ncbi:dienelactone hydrolase family protein [Luteococcus peritonei]|uniref:Dienelactone hydrolase family protein n=1 Tax=Luteococcus peritonei TaxID=88874 RepID=A0ABW4RWS7_9ACTN
MTTMILFHHVLGLTPGVIGLADRIREAGHEVVTPDLFEGRTFDNLSEGLAHVGSIGDGALLQRAEQACSAQPDDVVYAGLSLGVVVAQHLLQKRPGAVGGVLLHSFIAPAQLPGRWPDCPVHVFATDHDPFFVDDGDLAAAQAWRTSHANLEVHLYPGHGHLLLEPGLPDHDAHLAQQVTLDVLAALDEMERP